MNNEQLLAEVEDIIRTMPSVATLHHQTVENFSWLGRLAAFVEAWSLPQTLFLNPAVRQLHSSMAHELHSGLGTIQTLLYQARHDLRMKTVGPVNAAVGQALCSTISMKSES